MNHLEKLAKNVEKLAGKRVREEVMTGSEHLSADSSPVETTAWFRGALERLEAAVDPETARQIMSQCSCVFPREKLKKYQAQYAQSKNIEDIIVKMKDDPYMPNFEKQGDVLYVTKVPREADKYEKAVTLEEKRLYYCHCPWISFGTEKISATYCYCGSGWFKQIWEGILETPVRVEILETLVGGDEVCKFAIYLPRSGDL